MKKQYGNVGEKFEQLVNILKKLRSKDGCPWDREQTEETIINFLLEEIYETVDAVLQKNSEGVKEELGDVLMEVIFLAQIYNEKNEFNILDSLSSIIDKMIRRHPHVFGSQNISTAQEVIKNWKKIKKEEKKDINFNKLSSSPALFQAYQIGLKASRYGFDWKKAQEALKKVKEEIKELEKGIGSKKKEEIEEEIGDLFFSLVNVSRLLNINPEFALRKTNQKFIKRFRYIEEKLKKEGKEFSDVSLDYLDKIWDEAKKYKS
jgi:MazG family protein